MKVTVHAPTHGQEALMADLKTALQKHTGLSAVEMLAITAQLVGNLLAFQDQTARPAAVLMELVAKNIEEGNRAAIEGTLGEVAGRA